MRLFLSMLLPLSLACASVRAEPPARCTPDVSGALACMAGTACRCGFARGGILTGEPDGWRWDCGVLRGRCSPGVIATVPPAYELPPGFSYDGSNYLEQSLGQDDGPFDGPPRRHPDRDGGPDGPQRLFPDLPDRPLPRDDGFGRPPIEAPRPGLRFSSPPNAF